MAVKPAIYADVWTLPSSGVFEQVVDLPIPAEMLQYELRLRGQSTGRCQVSTQWPRLKEVCDPPTNVETLTRVWEKAADGEYRNVQSFINRFLQDEYKALGKATIAGPDLWDEFDHYKLHPFDWGTYDLGPGSNETGITNFPDTIYGGQNLLQNPGFEDGGLSNTRMALSTDRTGGVFSITYDGQTTSNLTITSPGAGEPLTSPTTADIKAALEALTNVVEVHVEGAGQPNQDPWIIEFVDPGEQLNPLISITDAGSGGTGIFFRYAYPTGGRGIPDPWTRSTNPNTGATHGGYTAFDVGSFIATGDPVHTGDKSLGIGPALGTTFAGAQQTVNVEPQGLYYAAIWVWAHAAGQSYALVLRDMNEKQISRQEVFNIPSQTWTLIEIEALSIPQNIRRVNFRVAVTSAVDVGGQLPSFWIDDAVFSPGLTPQSAGQIVQNLWTTANAEGWAVTWVKHDSFDGDLDSNGVAWDRLLSLYIPFGMSWLDIFEMLQGKGYEMTLTWNAVAVQYELKMFNPGGAGIVRGNEVRFSIPGIKDATINFQTPRANVILAEGGDGLVLELEDAILLAAYPRRTHFIRVDEANDVETLTAAAEYEMEKIKAEMVSVKAESSTIRVGIDLDCDIGDTVNVFLPPKIPASLPLRISNATTILTTSDGADNVTRTVDLSREVFREIMGGTTSSVTSAGLNQLLKEWEWLKRRLKQAPQLTGGCCPSLPARYSDVQTDFDNATNTLEFELTEDTDDDEIARVSTTFLNRVYLTSPGEYIVTSVFILTWLGVSPQGVAQFYINHGAHDDIAEATSRGGGIYELWKTYTELVIIEDIANDYLVFDMEFRYSLPAFILDGSDTYASLKIDIVKLRDLDPVAEEEGCA